MPCGRADAKYLHEPEATSSRAEFYRFLHEAAGTGMFENIGHLFEVHKD